jgi:hypothetical protein
MLQKTEAAALTRLGGAQALISRRHMHPHPSVVAMAAMKARSANAPASASLAGKEFRPKKTNEY